MRQIVDVKNWLEKPILPHLNTKDKLYKACRRGLPYKKDGRNLLFDVAAVMRYFDSLPGKDETL